MKAVFMVCLETLEKSLCQIVDSVIFVGEREGKDENGLKRTLLTW